VTELGISELTVVGETWQVVVNARLRCRQMVAESLQAMLSLEAMRIRNVGMLLNASPCQNFAPHDMIV
jgi:hypothetical protein